MVVLLLSALLGLLGSFLKPVPFVAVLVPVLGAAMLALALTSTLSWLAALAAFYGSLAVAELSYVGAVFVRYRPRRDTERGPWSAKDPRTA